MKIVFFLLALAVLSIAVPAPEEEKRDRKLSNANNVKIKPNNDAPRSGGKGIKKTPKANNATNTNGTEIDDDDEEFEDRDYCYDSTWSFTCRQTIAFEYELECKIANVDGDPCFPDLVKMIEASAPLTTIAYPIRTWTALESANKIDDLYNSMVTSENIEAISLHAPFYRLPADAFATLPHLKKITLESVDGVKSMIMDKNTFRNTTAKHLHLVGHDVRHFMDQNVDLHYFHTITFSDVEIDCYHDRRDHDHPPKVNISCERIFEHLKSIETLNLESIHVHGDELDERVLHPMWDTLKKLTMDVIFKRPLEKDDEKFEKIYECELKNNTNNEKFVNCSSIDRIVKYHGRFPVETFAYMTKLEDLELYLYEPIDGLTIENETVIPLPVSKSLTRLVLSCRYCKHISMQDLGKMLPNLHHLTVAAPLVNPILSDKCLKSLSKLEELIIYDGDLKGIHAGVFKNTPSIKHLSIKYASMTELINEHWEGLEDTLESLSIVGTPIKYINVSKLNHLKSLDISQNHLTTIQRDMLPEKAEFSELHISYNPIKHVENGFLSGIDMKNHTLRMKGWDIESFDLNALEGIEKLHAVDLTKNMKLTKLHVTDPKKLPTDLRKIIVGRSPLLKLDNEKENLSKMLIERNITLIVEGKIGCNCQMKWMIEMEKDHPELLEIDRARAICSRENTNVDQTMPESFWKTPTLINFLKSMKDDKTNLMCKNTTDTEAA